MYYSHELHSAASSGRFPPPQGGGPPPYYFVAGEFPSTLTPPYFNGLLPPLQNMMMRPLQRELTDGRFDAYTYANRAAAMAIIPSRNYGQRTHTVQHSHQMIMNIPAAWRRGHGYVQVQERNDLPNLEWAAALGRNWIQEDETVILDIGSEWRREKVERDRGLSDKLILKYLKTRKNSGDQVNSRDGEPKMCIVCQDDLCQEDGMMIGVLDCRHEYHASCIRQWLKQKNICPLCKTIALPLPVL
ncbi:UNVERIFIED_CONTAM: E3 ubiquitin-protein ligase MBR2 [Sesamum latifolium]|uniref:RING-type E3 ubiquitin transferase n=1 Tax=Sesamum latifolium TaxID=2727402 RepID=A0AAW2YCU6_9LAMI